MYNIQDRYSNEKHPSEYTLQDIIDLIEIDPRDAQKEHGSLKMNIDGYVISFDFKMNEDAGFDVENLKCFYGKYDEYSDNEDLRYAIEEKLNLAWHDPSIDVFSAVANTFKPII